jgi:hypothetical protein
MAEETKEGLKAMADELGLAVSSEKGGGEPTKEDYRRALDAHKAAQPAATSVEKGKATFKVVGPYAIFGKRNGETFEAEVKEQDETGALILVVPSGEWAVLGPLVDASQGPAKIERQ